MPSELYTFTNNVSLCQHIITYPISGGRLINVVAFVSEPEKEGTVYAGNEVELRPQQEMLDQYVGWEDEAVEVLQVGNINDMITSEIIKPTNPFCF